MFKVRPIFLVVVFFIAGLLWLSCANAKEQRMIVGFNKMASTAEQEFVNQRYGKFKRKFKQITAVTADLSKQEIAELRNNPDIAYIEEDAIVSAITPESGSLEYLNSWGVSHIGSAEVHAESITGRDIKVAVLDTGIDYNHPELVDSFRGGARFISTDLIPNNQDLFDDSWNSHGTHIAGIIAAASNDIEVVGVAPDISLYAVKILDGGGSGHISDLIAGIEWAIENDMDIINLSIGLRNDSQALAEACARAYEAGILLVAAAGNTGSYSFGEVLYPARYASVMAVGATSQDDTLHYISAFGPEIELVAPGDSIYSTTAGGYNMMTGTSQATPHVAGVAALILSAGIDDQNGDGVINNVDIRLHLQTTAVDLGEPGMDDMYGHGLVDALAALSGNEDDNTHHDQHRYRGWHKYQAYSDNQTEALLRNKWGKAKYKIREKHSNHPKNHHNSAALTMGNY